MYTPHRTTNGYSLIEVLIAVAILMLAIVAPMTIAVKSIQSSRYTLEQNTAIFLAQEGISIVETLRNHYALESINEDSDGYWDWTNDFVDCQSQHGCSFDARDPYSLGNNQNIVRCTESGENCRLHFNEAWARSAYRVGTNDGEPSSFIRRIYFDTLNNNEINIRVVVEWESGFLGQAQQVTVTSSLFNIYEPFAPDNNDD